MTKRFQYHIKVTPEARTMDDFFNRSTDVRNRMDSEACEAIAAAIRRHVDGIDDVLVVAEEEDGA